MWLLVGITMLLSGVVIANLTDETAYYLAQTNEERSESGVSKATRAIEVDDEQQQDNRALVDKGLKRYSKKSSAHRQSSLSTLLHWPDQDDQVLSVEQQKKPLNEERRNPSFNAWGGKRDLPQRYKTITKIRRPVRVPFNSWGGKRDTEKVQDESLASLKRGKFFNWGGKKAPPFNSWGGKRALISDFHRQYYQHQQDYGKQQQVNIDEGDDDLGSNKETQDKRGSLKLIAGGITTSGRTSDSDIPRVPFEPWGKKKRVELRFDVGARSASAPLTFRKIGRVITWNV